MMLVGPRQQADSAIVAIRDNELEQDAEEDKQMKYGQCHRGHP
jgi:hypothetical protein